jgi:hypothetical protein
MTETNWCAACEGQHATETCPDVVGVSSRARAALRIIGRFGGIDGAHHKQWVLDQVVRVLEGPDYATWVTKQTAGEDGPDTHDWDVGVAP